MPAKKSSSPISAELTARLLERPFLIHRFEPELRAAFGAADREELAVALRDYARKVQGKDRLVLRPDGDDVRFDSTRIRARPQEMAKYPVLDCVAGTPPSLVAARSDSNYRRPPVDVYHLRSPGMLVGFFNELPFVARARGADAVVFAQAMNDKYTLYNAFGGVPRRVNESQFIAHPAVLFDSHSWQNYAHWILDWLPKLHWVCESGGFSPADLTYIFDEPPRRFHLESLDMLGVPRHHVRHPDVRGETAVFRCDELYVTSLGSSEHREAAHVGSDWALSFLRDRLPARRDDTTPTRVVAESSKLALTDGARVALEQTGFVPVRVDQMSFGEQTSLFARAEYLIVDQGNLAANIPWCSPSASLLELFAPGQSAPTGFTISSFTGVDYCCAEISPVDTGGVPTVTVETLSSWFERSGL